jgi:HEPN domain-containing protein
MSLEQLFSQPWPPGKWFTGVPPDFQIIRQWMRLADHDLREAEHALNEPLDPAFEISCFHAQQAAEKYLKALLVANNLTIPSTHDLVRLANQLPSKSVLSVSIEDLAHLTPYAVNSRYPGVDVPETREDAVFALGIARNVRDACQKILNP